MSRFKSWTLRKGAVLVLLIGGVFASYQSEAVWAARGVPQIISYQGRLTDSSNNLLGGSGGTTYYFKFSIWNNSVVDSGTRLWPNAAPTSVSATVREGVFNVNIGDVASGYPNALTYDFATNADVYLEVQVSSDNSTFETLSPRQRISGSAFARTADSVVGSTTPSVFGGSAAIGNSTVSIIASSTNAVPLTIQGASGQTANLFRIENSGGTELFYANSSGALFASSTLQVTSNSIFYGSLGIGTTSPGTSFSVQGVGNFAIGTSTLYQGLAVGGLTATSSGLTVSGGSISLTSSATSTFNQGLNITAGCFAVSGNCAVTGASGG
ncbi:MAG: hypothetical protein HYT43_01925, partial [Candidatus Taylorbacteria bacterium]|nr:hypothetical protein [Candidatus Taylorbacteria bacterium]